MNRHAWSNRLLLIAVFLLALTGIGCSDRSEKYKNLPESEKLKLFEREKTALIHQEICNKFIRELHTYKTDLAEKELKQFYEYFRDYPFHFRLMQMETLYPSYERLIALGLEGKGIKYDPSFKNWDAPNLEDLSCQKTITEWFVAKSQWERLKKTLPVEYYKQYSLWDQFSSCIDELFISTQKAFYSTIAFIIILGITIYTLMLHYTLLSKQDKSWIWLIPLTPLCALYWQKHIGYLKDKGYDFTTRVFITALLLSVLFFCVSYVASRTLKARNRNDHNALGKAQTHSEAVHADPYLTAFFITIDLGNVERLKNLINWDIDLINERDTDGLTALQLISSKSLGMTKNHVDMVRVLLAHGANANSVTLSGLNETSLHLISKHGPETSQNHIHLAELLLENGCDVDAKNSMGVTVYRQILEDGAPALLPILEIVLARQPEPVLQLMRSEGSIPLHISSELIDRAEVYEAFLCSSHAETNFEELSAMTNPSVDTDQNLSVNKPIQPENPAVVSTLELPSLQDRERFLDLMYELGAHSVYEPDAIFDYLTELGIACDKTPTSVLLFKKFSIPVHEPEWGTAGIWPTDIIRAAIAYYGYDIHSRMSGRGFYHKDLISQLAKEWEVQKEYP